MAIFLFNLKLSIMKKTILIIFYFFILTIISCKKDESINLAPKSINQIKKNTASSYVSGLLNNYLVIENILNTSNITFEDLNEIAKVSTNINDFKNRLISNGISEFNANLIILNLDSLKYNMSHLPNEKEELSKVLMNGGFGVELPMFPCRDINGYYKCQQGPLEDYQDAQIEFVFESVFFLGLILSTEGGAIALSTAYLMKINSIRNSAKRYERDVADCKSRYCD